MTSATIYCPHDRSPLERLEPGPSNVAFILHPVYQGEDREYYEREDEALIVDVFQCLVCGHLDLRERVIDRPAKGGE